MAEAADAPSEVEGQLLGQIADEVADRLRRGEQPNLSDYAKQHPHIARLILEGLPLLQMVRARPEPPPEASAPPDPERLGEYRLLRRIGRGGMGTVYEAEQPGLGRSVALKVLSPLFASPSAVERFRREAQAVARLHHTNIVPVYFVGEEGGAHFFAMQLIRGRGLDQVVREETALRVQDSEVKGSSDSRTPESSLLTPDRIALTGFQVADALAHAHSSGVIHRDIKPSNVLVDEGGNAWLTDFGLARVNGLSDLTRDGEIVGTLRFMAPECFRGEADGRSDVYGLGMTLYELLTRRPAFGESDRGRLFWQVANEDPARPRTIDPRIPRDLETIVWKAIAKEPSRRYATAREMADDLRRFLDNQPIRARRATRLEQGWRWCRRNPLPAGLMTGIFLLLGAIAVGATSTALRLNEQKQEISENLVRAERAELAALQEKQTAQRRTWEAILAEASLTQSSPLAGRRLETLVKLDEASGLLPVIESSLRDRRRMRDLATRTLTSPDLIPGPLWEGTIAGPYPIGYDASRRRRALVTSTGELRVCQTPDQPSEWSVQAPAGFRPLSAAFSASGQYLAVIASRGLVERRLLLWEIGKPEPRLDLPNVTEAVFSPDSRRLMCLSRGFGVECYSLGGVIERESGFESVRARAVAFSPDGVRYACLHPTEHLVELRSSARHGALGSFAFENKHVQGIVWFRDSEYLALVHPDSVSIHNTRNGALVSRLICPTGIVGGVAINGTDEWLAAVGTDGWLNVWDVWSDANVCVRVRPTLKQPLRNVRFGPDGVTAESVNGWQQFGFEPAGEYRRMHARRPLGSLAAVIGGNGRWLVAAAPTDSKDAPVVLWDLEKGREVQVPKSAIQVDGLFADPNGDEFYVLQNQTASPRLLRWSVRVAGEDGVSVLYISSPSELPFPWPSASLHRGSLALSPDGQHVVWAGLFTEPRSPELAKHGDEPPARLQLAFVLATLTEFKMGKWSRSVEAVLPLESESATVRPEDFNRLRLAVSPGASWLAMDRRDYTTTIRNIVRRNDQRPPEPIRGPFWDLTQSPSVAAAHRYHDALPRTIAFSPDGHWFLEGCVGEYCVRRPGSWDVQFRRAIQDKRQNPASAAFSPDSTLVAMTASRREVTLLRTGTWEEVAALPLRADEVLNWVGFTPDGGRLVATSRTGVHVWDLGRIRCKWRDLGVDIEQEPVPLP